MNRQDIAYQVSVSLGDHADDYNIDGIVDDLVAAHDGDLKSIDDFDSESYWAIVETHDTSTEAEPTALAFLTLAADCLIHDDGAEVGIIDYNDVDDVTSEPLAPVSLSVDLDEGDQAMKAAKTRLAELGWETVGDWDGVDTGYTIKVRRTSSAG